MKKIFAAFILLLTPLLSLAQSGADDGFVDFSLGYQIMCGVRADHSATCETSDFYAKFALPDNSPPLVLIDSGASHSCGVT